MLADYILISTLPPRDHEDVVEALSGTGRVQYCHRPDAVRQLVVTRPVNAVAWHCDGSRRGEVIRAVVDVAAEQPCVRHLIRLDTGEMSCDQLAMLSRLRAPLMISFAKHYSVAHDVAELRGLNEGLSGDAHVLDTLLNCAREPQQRLGGLLPALLAVGRAGGSVSQLARVARLRPSAVRGLVREQFAIGASELLRWVFALHFLSDIESGRSLKELSASAGYRSPEALTNRLARLVGCRLREIRRGGGLVTVTERFYARVAGA